jgi:hypothetical protein
MLIIRTFHCLHLFSIKVILHEQVFVFASVFTANINEQESVGEKQATENYFGKQNLLVNLLPIDGL